MIKLTASDSAIPGNADLCSPLTAVSSIDHIRNEISRLLMLLDDETRFPTLDAIEVASERLTEASFWLFAARSALQN